MDDLIGLNEKGLVLAEPVAGRLSLGAGLVGTFAGKDAMDQIMVAYGRTEGVVGLALFPAVLVDGDVKVVIAEK